VAKRKTAPQRAGQKQSIEARAIKALELIGDDPHEFARVVTFMEELLAQRRLSSVRTK
jgi:hypothetical protein